MTSPVPEEPETLLVVCRANLIRSPWTAALLRRRLSAQGRSDLYVESCGLEVVPGAQAGTAALEVAGSRTLDVAGHVATPVTRAQLLGSALVVTMTETQRTAVGRLAPAVVSRTFTLRELARLLAHPGTPRPAGWAELARAAHAVRPLVAPATEPEDVLDPVGRPVQDHQVTADLLTQLSDRLVAHLLPTAVRPG